MTVSSRGGAGSPPAPSSFIGGLTGYEALDLLATMVNDEVETTGRQSLGVSQRQKGIWVLQATNMPAILIETGFINNPEDERYLNSEKGQQELAEAITKAVKRYKEQVESINNKPTANTNQPAVTSNNPADVPDVLEKRPVKDSKVLEVKSNKVKIDLYDDGEIDNDIVSVYFIEDEQGNAISKEFCGGPHVEKTGVLGTFKIQKEEAVSAGVRRIKATLI